MSSIIVRNNHKYSLLYLMGFRATTVRKYDAKKDQ